jgi:Flp pilus assembly protein TadD
MNQNAIKKTLFALLLTCSASGAYAQQSSFDSGKLDVAKEESDKAILDEKNALKARTWALRGQIYESIAIDQTKMYAKLDSSASITAYNSYKKAIELDTKEGKEGKVAKEAREYLAGQKLYAGLMMQGAAQYQNKNMKDAYKLMALASEVNAKDTTAAMYAGVVAQQLKDDESTLKYFDKFLALGGKDPVIYYTLANIYRNRKDEAKAIEWLDKGIEKNPNNKDLKNERINILLASGKTDEAVSGLKKMIEKDPNNVTNILNVGILYDNAAQETGRQLNKLKEQAGGSALDGLKKKVQSQKDKSDAFDEEIKRLTDKIKKDPKTAAQSKKQLGDVTRLRDEEKAKYEQMNADLQKQEAEASVNAGGSAAKIEELSKKYAEQKTGAAEYYNKALAVEPANYDANYNMGVFYYNEGVEIKKKADNMEMKVYQTQGKAVEEQAIVKFKQAMPYFEKSFTVRQESDIKENLRNLYNVLKQLEKTDAYEAKLKAVE